MKIQPFKRILLEDYDQKYSDIIDKLGNSINLFADDVYNAMTNRLTIEDNLAQSKKTVTVTVNSSGAPTTPVTFKTGLTNLCFGIDVVRVINNTSPTTYPTSMPLVSFTENNHIITVNNITGLQANNSYSLYMILIS